MFLLFIERTVGTLCVSLPKLLGCVAGLVVKLAVLNCAVCHITCYSTICRESRVRFLHSSNSFVLLLFKPLSLLVSPLKPMSFLFMALWEQHSKLGARRTARRL
jgi:hypothetical protein